MRLNIVLLFIAVLLLGKKAEAQIVSVPESIGKVPVMVDLNGDWAFQTDGKIALEKVTNKSGEWKNIEVPGEWYMQGFNVEPGNRGTYYRTFNIPKSWKNHTIYLRCDAVFSNAEVAINGTSAGKHSSPMVAFDKDVSKYIKCGKENAIAVGVVAETMEDTLMSATQYAAHPMGGILRKIYLYAVPKVHLANLKVETDFDSNYCNAKLKVNAQVVNTTNAKEVEITSSLTDPQGNKVQLDNPKQTFVLTEKGSEIDFDFDIEAPLKWDAEHPNLYKLTLEVRSAAGVETLVKQVGFREIKVVGNQLFVNGSPIKMKGVNRHEVHPLRGRSLTPELCKQDAEIFKRGNVNYIRTSHYPPSEEFVEWCDKLGLYVEVENPLCWIGHHANKHWQKHDPKNSASYPYFEEVSKANIDFFRNHPSIIIWSMANESMWTENWSKLADFYAGEDQTRPVTFHDQAYGGFNNYGSKKMPVANIHYPGTAGPNVAEDFKRPLLFGEYAHLNTYNRVEIVTDPGVRDAWGRGFKSMWDNMYKSRGCLGGAIWSGIDDVFYLPDGRAVGYGEWGPIDGWRREKPEYFHMKKSYSPVRIHNHHVEVPANGEPIRLQIENRFDFTNLKECKINWEVAGEKGVVALDLPAKQMGILEVLPQSAKLDGNILKVQILSPQGMEVETCMIEIGDVKRDDFPFGVMAKGNLWTANENDLLIIKGKDFSWGFDLKQGKLASAVVDGKRVLNQGAELMILSLKTGGCLTEHDLNIPFHNETCSEWEALSTEWNEQNDTVNVIVKGSYAEAEGVIKYSFTNDGKMDVTYDLKSKIAVSPRQLGMVFTAPSDMKNLQWYRKGLWSWYPENHIGRIKGKAIPFGDKAFMLEKFRQVPENEWKYDANSLGTSDFRSTRENIYWAALTNDSGVGLTVLGNGKQAFRSFVKESGISFLVADYSTGGGDMFFGGHYSKERIKIEKGADIKGSIKIKLLRQQ